MSDDWKAGDLAVFVDDSIPPSPGEDVLVLGKIYTVSAVDTRPKDLGLFLAEAKSFEDEAHFYIWRSSMFRKVKPDTDACDREEWELIMNVNKSRIKERG